MFESNSYFIDDILKKYLVPTIVVLLEVSSISFFNTLIVGKMLGNEALAVMSLTSSFSFLYFMFGCLINIGASIAASMALGQRDLKRVGKFENLALWESVLIPVLISIVLLLFMHPFMMLLGADESMYQLSKDYVRIILAFGFVYTLMYYPFNFLRVDGRTQKATGVFALMAGLDFVSVFFVLKMGWGLTAVGFASVLSALVADVIGILILFYGKDRQIRIEKMKTDEVIPMLSEAFQLGSSAGLNNLWNMLRTMALNKLVVDAFGKDGLAVFAVACSIINLTNATTLGVGQTTAPIIGVFYGERDNRSIQMLMRSGAKYSVLIHIVMFTALGLLAPQVAGAFGISGALLPTCVSVIRWTALGLISSGRVNLYINAYAAIKRVVVSNVLTFLRSYGLVVVVATLLIKAEIFADYYITSFMWADIWTVGFMYMIAAWVRKQDPNTYGIMMLDKRREEGNYLSFSVSAEKGKASETSERIAHFCKENEIPENITLGIWLSLEEILSVMSEHCLHNEKNKFLDVRIFKENEEILLRVRCGGEIFDPLNWYREKEKRLSKEELDEDSSLGIKLLMEYSKELNFFRTFGVNNLIAVI